MIEFLLVRRKISDHKGEHSMPEGFHVLAEISSAVISTIVAIPLESGSSLIKRKIEKRTLKKKIRKRSEYLKQKYKDNFERLCMAKRRRNHKKNIIILQC